MIGVLACLFGLGAWGRDTANREIEHNLSRDAAKKCGNKIFHGKDKKGDGIFATDTGRRVYYNETNGYWTEIKTGRKVKKVEGYDSVKSDFHDDEWKEKQLSYIEKNAKEAKQNSIKDGCPIYNTSIMINNRRKNIKRLVKTDLELCCESGCPHGVWQEARFLFWVFPDPEYSVWYRKHNGLYFDGKPIETYIKDTNTRTFNSFVNNYNEGNGNWDYLEGRKTTFTPRDLKEFCVKNDIMLHEQMIMEV